VDFIQKGVTDARSLVEGGATTREGIVYQGVRLSDAHHDQSVLFSLPPFCAPPRQSQQQHNTPEDMKQQSGGGGGDGGDGDGGR